MNNIPRTPAEYRAWWQKQRPEIPYGYCWCGCGSATTAAKHNDKANGYVKGEPKRYAPNHHGRWARRGHSSFDPTLPVTECWLWQRETTDRGYGIIRRGGDKKYAHRAVYEAIKGPIPENLELDHLCRQTGCANPDHLQPVPHLINVRRGRSMRFTPDAVRKMHRLYSEGRSYRSIARQFGMSDSHVRKIIRGEIWSDIQG